MVFLVFPTVFLRPTALFGLGLRRRRIAWTRSWRHTTGRWGSWRISPLGGRWGGRWRICFCVFGIFWASLGFDGSNFWDPRWFLQVVVFWKRKAWFVFFLCFFKPWALPFGEYLFLLLCFFLGILGFFGVCFFNVFFEFIVFLFLDLSGTVLAVLFGCFLGLFFVVFIRKFLGFGWFWYFFKCFFFFLGWTVLVLTCFNRGVFFGFWGGI